MHWSPSAEAPPARQGGIKTRKTPTRGDIGDDVPFDARTITLPDDRLFSLPGTVSPKPGLIRVPDHQGPGIVVKVWALPPAAFGCFAARIPAPLGIGKLTLADGTQVSGVLCEGHAVDGAQEFASFGGRRAWRATQTRRPAQIRLPRRIVGLARGAIGTI